MIKSGSAFNFYQYTLFFCLQTAWKRAARFHAFHLWHGHLQLTLKCRALQIKLFCYRLVPRGFLLTLSRQLKPALKQTALLEWEEQGGQSLSWYKLPFC